jgi:hypothetical protein
MGRIWFDGREHEDVIAQCKEIWAIGGSDAEAALFAKISASSLSRYMDANKDIKDLRNALQQNPVLKARRTIEAKLSDVETAKWYLERKRKEEFASRSEVTGKDGERLIPDAQSKERADQAINEFLNGKSTKQPNPGRDTPDGDTSR